MAKPTKGKKPSVATIAQEVRAEKQPWASWERKVERLNSRDFTTIMQGWLSHPPTISSPGAPPSEPLESISTLSDSFHLAGATGDHTGIFSGARPAVLHQAFFWAHKAVHAQIACARNLSAGRQTWAVIDAYQSSLFALASVLAFLGIVEARDRSQHITIDVWAPCETPRPKSKGILLTPPENYQLIRWQSLDHFHKWAILKRVLRTLKIQSPLIHQLSNSLEGVNDRELASHRNKVHYSVEGWLTGDLLHDDVAGPIRPAATAEAAFQDIYENSISGTVYLMTALIEVACMFAQHLHTSTVLTEEIALLERRKTVAKSFSEFSWQDLYA